MVSLQITKRKKRQLLLLSATIFAYLSFPSKQFEDATSSSFSTKFLRHLSANDDFTSFIDYEKVELMHQDIGCISRTHELIFVNIPHTSGKAIEHSFLFDDSRMMLQYDLRQDISQPHTAITLFANSKQREIDQFTTATVIRHPCDRFIAAFQYLTSDRASEWEQERSTRIIGDKSIDEFVELMHATEWKIWTFIDFSMQYMFLMLKGKVTTENVMCFEQWQESIQRLEYVLNLEEDQLVNDLPTTPLEYNEEMTCADLKPETRQMIEERYVTLSSRFVVPVSFTSYLIQIFYRIDMSWITVFSPIPLYRKMVIVESASEMVSIKKTLQRGS